MAKQEKGVSAADKQWIMLPLFCLMLPCALFLFVFGGIVSPFCACMTSDSKVWETDLRLENLTPGKKTFSLLTQNMYNPPVIVNIPLVPRIEALLEQTDADIICLQEIFGLTSFGCPFPCSPNGWASDIKKVIKVFNAKGYNVAQPKNWFYFSCNSGCLIASKFPIVEDKFTEFKQNDKGLPIKRGFQHVDVDIYGEIVTIMTTHTIPVWEEKDLSACFDNLNDMKPVFNQNKLTILACDLNVDRILWDMVDSDFSERKDIFKEAYGGENVWTWMSAPEEYKVRTDGTKVCGKDWKESLDFVLMNKFSEESGKLHAVECEWTYYTWDEATYEYPYDKGISDHRGILTKFLLEEKSEDSANESDESIEPKSEPEDKDLPESSESNSQVSEGMESDQEDSEDESENALTHDLAEVSLETFAEFICVTFNGAVILILIMRACWSSEKNLDSSRSSIRESV